MGSSTPGCPVLRLSWSLLKLTMPTAHRRSKPASTVGWMDKENVVSIQWDVLFSHKKEGNSMKEAEHRQQVT